MFRRLVFSWRGALLGVLASVAAIGFAIPANAASPVTSLTNPAFVQVNLVSNQPGVAPLTDTDLVNAWGLAASPGTDQAPGTPLWVSDNGSDKATLYNNGTATTVAKFPLTIGVTVLPRPGRYSTQTQTRTTSSSPTPAVTPAGPCSSSTPRTARSTAGARVSAPPVPDSRR